MHKRALRHTILLLKLIIIIRLLCLPLNYSGNRQRILISLPDRLTIRIPIYEIHTADFTLPISIYYTTGGIKVNQLNGSVALGWQLDAEPMITRNTRGKPDEVSTLLQGSLIKEDSENYRRLVGKGETDPMQDIFIIVC